jgi:hypothetical protein
VDLEKLDVFLIQETMCPSSGVVGKLSKLFLGWNFYGVDSNGLLGGLITWLYLNFTLIN